MQKEVQQIEEQSLSDSDLDQTLIPHPPSEKQDKVAVIYTGGTIGMTPNINGHLSPEGRSHSDTNFLTHLITTNKIFHHPDIPKFDLFTTLPLLDSANMDQNDWFRIARIIQRLYDLYDGFVVIHGTDTMAYTASILSFILINLNKPVILTGAQLPCSSAYSDGYFNLIGAI